MNATQALHHFGQNLWLDNITRALLDSGTLTRYIRDFAITGLTSNPTIFEQAIRHSNVYDDAINREAKAGQWGEALLFALALDDLRRAADLFLPVFEASKGADGWVSLEVSPLLAHEAARTTAAAADLHASAARPNVFIKIPGTPEGLVAIEASIFAGIPINVTLLFSRAQYQATAEAYLRGIERRLAVGLHPRVRSVASLFVSRWDVAANPVLPPPLRNQLGIAIAAQTYQAYQQMLASPRWHGLAAAGAPVQRLLWASTGSKDPAAPDTLYVDALAAPGTINTMPEKTLLAFAGHGQIKPSLASADAAAIMSACRQAGVDTDALAERLQCEGADAFAASWRALLGHIAAKASALTQAGVQ
jgi:transaldolase